MQGKRGRPRNMDTHDAILTASYDLLLECGFGEVTVEKIAERAKVSKATIYKWWPNKAAVVMDGFLFAATARLPVPDTGSVSGDVLAHATNTARFTRSREGVVLLEIIGEGQIDASLAEALRTRYIQPRRLEFRGILEKGMQRGELPASVDVALITDLIYGSIFYRLLVSGDPVDDAYVEQLVQHVFDGIGARTR
ncbi:TetR/AcrR family transcriptional regulator [Paenibacillus methanolicus]|uniref:AcrR family transcriptional regulator n=1 Tax=Paenibacillus methanolicus TaxID=582686 RepID=A0A5S5C155_9BACL|nr:TetR/AcrR family transcriptional regulator [Paenibacillus methanolicus]TYP73165.1 AcrR family transcriptional regulator [Paenibacillus methanolicus]